MKTAKTVLAFLLLCSLSLLSAAGREKEDGVPLLYKNEIENINAVWGQIEKGSLSEAAAPDKVGFISLAKQSKGYRGKSVRIEGRLLRINEISIPFTKNDSLNLETFYESWVLLDDEKEIPAILLTREIPAGLEAASSNTPDLPLRRERISASGISYRLAAYNGGDDFYTSPVIIAETFTLLHSGGTVIAESKKNISSWSLKGAALAILFFLWILVRFILFPRIRRSKPISYSSSPSKTTPVPDNFEFNEDELQEMRQISKTDEQQSERSADSPQNGTAGKFFSLLFAVLLISGTLTAQEENEEVSEPVSPINTEFWSEVTPIDTEKFFQTTSESDPFFLETIQIVLDRLQNGISLPLLERSIPKEITETEKSGMSAGNRFFDNYPAHFGVPIPFRGKVAEINQVSSSLFRVLLQTDSGQLAVYLPQIPKGWKETAKGIGAAGSGIGIFFAKYEIPVIAAPRISWLNSATPLGELGFDISLFDQVPALPITALSEKLPDEKRREILRNFRLTPADHDSFYGLLAEAAAAAPGSLKKAEEKARSAGTAEQTVSLFNRPDEMQGKLVTLTGHLRRAQKVIIPESDTQTFFGLSHYYELYLFTAHSQDYPVLFCVPNLPLSPDGRELPTGTGPNYREEVTLTGFLYKPWAYQIDSANASLAPGFLENDQTEGKSWIAVPLMIGGDGIWNPNASASETDAPISDGVLWLLAGFTFLLLLYLTARRRRSKPIEIRIGGPHHS